MSSSSRQAHWSSEWKAAWPRPFSQEDMIPDSIFLTTELYP